jgi:hypothetical protein
MYCPGPNKVNRILYDGQTFTDVNYWKQYAYPAMPMNQAFILVLADDGSVWNDFAPENTYPISYSTVLLAGSTYTTYPDLWPATTANPHQTAFNILADNGSAAVFTQITNNAGAGSYITARINGTALLQIGGATTQVFDTGDLAITKLEFDNSASGGGNAAVTIFMSIQQQAQS